VADRAGFPFLGNLNGIQGQQPGSDRIKAARCAALPARKSAAAGADHTQFSLDLTVKMPTPTRKGTVNAGFCNGLRTLPAVSGLCRQTNIALIGR
jgi:hypothetical protein